VDLLRGEVTMVMALDHGSIELDTFRGVIPPKDGETVVVPEGVTAN
jgi:hypothetical protein